MTSPVSEENMETADVIVITIRKIKQQNTNYWFVVIVFSFLEIYLFLDGYIILLYCVYFLATRSTQTCIWVYVCIYSILQKCKSCYKCMI